MKDAWGRTIEYVCLSLTDACNFCCPYCRPAEITPQSQTQLLSVDEWMTILGAFHRIGVKAVRLTGGEPLLHFNNPVLIESLEHFYRLGHTLTVETNAALPIAFDKTVLSKARFSMSVKLSNSGESRDKRINYSTIRAIVDNTEQSYFKFVVSKDTWEQDKEEIFEILDNTGRSIPVYLMPLGGDFKSLQNNTQFVVEKCIEQGFFYTDRIHIRAWNTKEGV